MFKVLFFAKLREDLDCSELSITVVAPVHGRSALIAAIAEHVKASQGELKAEMVVEKLSAANIVMAINHQVSKGDVVVKSGDEIAFYPPVTGG